MIRFFENCISYQWYDSDISVIAILPTPALIFGPVVFARQFHLQLGWTGLVGSVDFEGLAKVGRWHFEDDLFAGHWLGLETFEDELGEEAGDDDFTPEDTFRRGLIYYFNLINYANYALEIWRNHTLVADCSTMFYVAYTVLARSNWLSLIQ